MCFQGSGWRAWEPEQRKSSVTGSEPTREGCWEKQKKIMRQTQETQCIREINFHFRSINSSINILTKAIRGLATLCISASSLPSPDSNHFGAYIKLSNKKVLLVTPLTYCTFQGCPATLMFPAASSPVNYSVSFPSPSLVFAYPFRVIRGLIT